MVVVFIREQLCVFCALLYCFYISMSRRIVFLECIRAMCACVCLHPVAYERDVCTFNATGRTFCRQKWFSCITCGLVKNAGVCQSCARTCHDGHECVCFPCCGAVSGPCACDSVLW